MADIYKESADSRVTLSQLMLPSHSNFSGKIHGGYLLSLMDQVAFACGSKFSGRYCVTASVDRVDFLNPIEVGELVTLKASVVFVGNSSMVVGIRVEAQNIQTGEIKHCNSSYFTMIAKEDGKNARVPRLILTSEAEVMRFLQASQRIQLRHGNSNLYADDVEGDLEHAIEQITREHDVKVNIKTA